MPHLQCPDLSNDSFLSRLKHTLYCQLHAFNDDSKFTKSRKVLTRAILYGLASLIVIQLDLFGLSSKSDEAFRDFLYRVSAPLYDDVARDDIVVVLLTEEGTEKLHTEKLVQPDGSKRSVFDANEWPITYRDHGEILSTILNYEPRSVFVDIYFRQERSLDDSADEFLNFTSDMSGLFDVNVYFAGGYPTSVETNSGKYQHTDFQNKISSMFEMPINGWYGVKNTYPLSINNQLTAASKLYQDACLGVDPLDSCNENMVEISRATQAISVLWGAYPPSKSMNTIKNDCDYSYLKDLRTGVFGDNSGAKCPFHQVIFASHLKIKHLNGDFEELDELLNNKIVLYSADYLGLGDYVDSPVHGNLPGVHFHAMALDNLISLGNNYIKSSLDQTAKLLHLLALLIIPFILSLIAVLWNPGKLVRLGSSVVLVLIYSAFSLFALKLEPIYAISMFQGLAITIISIDSFIESSKKESMGFLIRVSNFNKLGGSKPCCPTSEN